MGVVAVAGALVVGNILGAGGNRGCGGGFDVIGI